MKNKIIEFIPQKLIVLLNIIAFVNIIMVYASYAYLTPLIKHTFYYLLNHIANEAYANKMLVNYGTGDSINSLIVTVIFTLHSFFLTLIYCQIIMSACALITFRTVFKLTDFLLRAKNYKLHKNTSFIQEVKLISLWVALYSLINFIILGLGLPDFWYNKLTILSQATIFYLLLTNSSINFTIIKNEKTSGTKKSSR